MDNGICVMCKLDTDDQYRFGQKITSDDVTAHFFCLMLSSDLPQNGSDDEGICGFMLKDIKKEEKRAKKMRCCYCHDYGANVSCCDKKCRKSFHLPCATHQDCRFEFTDRFQSFCDLHHGIPERETCHDASDLCAICYQPMGHYNVIRSIQSSCCEADSWFHKICLQKYAVTAGYFLKCPLCNDSDEFRDGIMRLGVFIPDSDAQWEEVGQNTFYGFEHQYDSRPRECAAEHCRMPQGRQYYIDENDEYLLIKCERCGSKGVHENCVQTVDNFLCDDCELEPLAKKRRTNDHDDFEN